MADELLCTAQNVSDAWAAFGSLPVGEQTQLIATASQHIINFCRRPFFAQHMETEYLDGKNQSHLWLSLKPVISVAAVSINGEPLDNTAGDAWTFVPGTGKLLRGTGKQDDRFARSWPSGTGNIAVTYWAGFATVPDPVVRAAIMTVRWIYEQGKRPGIYASESIGDYSYSLNQTFLKMPLPDYIAGLLANYVQDDAFAFA